MTDTAMYRCHATNPLGDDETSCLLNVEGMTQCACGLTRECCVFAEVRRTRRAHSTHPGERETSRARSPSPLVTSGKDSSWRDKLGAADRPAARDTLDVQKPRESHTIVDVRYEFDALQNTRSVEKRRNSAHNWRMPPYSRVGIRRASFRR